MAISAGEQIGGTVTIVTQFVDRDDKFGKRIIALRYQDSVLDEKYPAEFDFDTCYVASDPTCVPGYRFKSCQSLHNHMERDQLTIVGASTCDIVWNSLLEIYKTNTVINVGSFV